MRPMYWALIVLLGAVWGCSFLFNAILVRELGPIWISGLRTLIGALGCWVFFVATRRTLPLDPKLYAQLLVLGILNYAIPFTLFPIAAPYVASGIIGVINGMTPMTTVLVSQFWPGAEKATGNKIIGVLIGFVGAVILASPSFTDGGGSSQLWAIGACLLATFCYALTLNYARRFKAVDSTTVAASSLTAASLVTIPIAFLSEGVPVITLPETWAALFAIGLLSSTFAFLLLYWLLPRVGATNMSLNTYITPISAIFLGILVLQESFELVHVLGIVVIFIGLVIMDGRLVKRLRKAPA